MRPGIFGKKVGMTTIFDDNGVAIPVTIIDASEAVITQIKTKQTDGYNAVQIGFGYRKPQNATKAMAGHFKKASVPVKAKTQELRFSDTDDLTQLKSGQSLAATMFTKGDLVEVVATCKGLGFTGVIKRYGWHGADATHGVSKYFRHGGSTGTNTFPGRVLKNHGNPGQTGNTPVTVANLRVVDVIADKNLLIVKGAVPGPRGGFVMVRNSKRVPLPAGRAFTAA